MPRRRLAELPVKEQVARKRRAHIAAYEVGVSINQRPGVSKLRKCTIRYVLRHKGTWHHAKKPRSKRRVRIGPRANFAGGSGYLDSSGLEPGFVVTFKRFAI